MLSPKPPEEPDLPDPCTLSSLLDYIISETRLGVQTNIIDTLLYTFFIYSTKEELLELLDQKFWSLCTCEDMEMKSKITAINSLRVILTRWLNPPHISTFCPKTGSDELSLLVQRVFKWFCVFRPRDFDSTPTSSLDWIKSYVSLSAKPNDVSLIRVMFFGADQKLLQRLAFKLAAVCKRAEEHRVMLIRAFQTFSLSFESVYTPSRKNSVRSVSTTGWPLLKPLKQHRSVKSISKNIARELSAIDQQLFANLRVFECLQHVRNKSAPTVMATIDQFNHVVRSVQSSVLKLITPAGFRQSLSEVQYNVREPLHAVKNRLLKRDRFSTQEIDTNSDNCTRSDLITMWIGVATCLSEFNNLTSLHAVLTGLQTTAIYRLTSDWQQTERLHPDQIRQFKSLEAMMSHEFNYKCVRERIRQHIKQFQKFSEANRKRRSKRISGHGSVLILSSDEDHTCADKPGDQKDQNHSSNSELGLIPYLGMYLQDFTYLHYAMPDMKKYDSERRSRGSHPAALCLSPTASSPSLPSSTDDSLRQDAPVIHSMYTAACLHDSHFDRSSNRSVSPHLTPRENNVFNMPALPKVRSINFGKHMRETRELQDLYLLQCSNKYRAFRSDPNYRYWLESLPQLSEDEVKQLSHEIEPPTDLKPTRRNMTYTKGYEEKDRSSNFLSVPASHATNSKPRPALTPTAFLRNGKCTGASQSQPSSPEFHRIFRLKPPPSDHQPRRWSPPTENLSTFKMNQHPIRIITDSRVRSLSRTKIRPHVNVVLRNKTVSNQQSILNERHLYKSGSMADLTDELSVSEYNQRFRIRQM